MKFHQIKNFVSFGNKVCTDLKKLVFVDSYYTSNFVLVLLPN